MARILLGVSGSVAAYKSVELVRLAVKAGHRVRVIQTPASLNFVGKSSFEAVSGAPVLVGEFDQDPARGAYPGDESPLHDPISHLELVARADLFAIAPASANTIAKLAVGQADNLLTTAVLACTSPVVLAPAMNSNMWKNSATQENVQRLRDRGMYVVEPETGSLASRGEWGIGRYPEVSTLLETIESIARARVPRGMDGLRVLVTAGGTREPIDRVRFLGNRSSGRMGYELAQEAFRRGAKVTVLSANVGLPRQPGITYIDTPTAAAIYKRAKELSGETDVVIMAAAVADYRPRSAAAGKIGKDQGLSTIELVENPDIIADLADKRKPGQVLVGFAAEYGPDRGRSAREKLVRKGLDAVILNDVSREDIGFDVAENEVSIIDTQGERKVAKTSKAEVAAQVLDEVERLRAGQIASGVGPS